MELCPDERFQRTITPLLFLGAFQKVMDDSLGLGVVYRGEDHVGLVRRLLVFWIDLLLLTFVGSLTWLVFAILSAILRPEGNPSLGVGLLLWLTVWWIYLVPLKRSRFGTLGYWLLGIKIVSLTGDRPALWRLTMRPLLCLYSPTNLMLDFLWIGADPARQCLRDCYAGTLVVRKHAQPIARTPLHLTRYAALGCFYVYPRATSPQGTRRHDVLGQPIS